MSKVRRNWLILKTGINVGASLGQGWFQRLLKIPTGERTLLILNVYYPPAKFDSQVCVTPSFPGSEHTTPSLWYAGQGEKEPQLIGTITPELPLQLINKHVRGMLKRPLCDGGTFFHKPEPQRAGI